MQSKNIFFDWNGTLLDDFHALHEAINCVLDRGGHQRVDADNFRRGYENTPQALYSNLGLKPHEVERVVKYEGETFHENYEALAVNAGLRDGGSEILHYMNDNNIKPIILSNHIVDAIRAQLQRLQIEHLVADVLAFADRAVQFTGLTKGDRLKNHMTVYKMNPEHTLIVGDSLEEIHVAREYGVISVAITGGGTSEEKLRLEKPDHLIHSLHELKPILQERSFVS
jgi:phosphoglycolate phosphatase